MTIILNNTLVHGSYNPVNDYEKTIQILSTKILSNKKITCKQQCWIRIVENIVYTVWLLMLLVEMFFLM